MIRLYDSSRSGNCYKVRLLLSQLGEPFERVELDMRDRTARPREFLEKSPDHRVPLVEWPDGRRLAESDAILWYLADGTPFLPEERWERAQVLQWMFFEQYSHEPYIAVVRFWHIAGLVEKNHDALAGKVDRGVHALGVMEKHLASRAFFVDERYSIADIALYAYTHVAHEGGFDLAGFPSIVAWLERVRSQPRHVAITDPVGNPISWPV
jgi:glutathione S-transferase